MIAYCAERGIPPSEFDARWTDDDQDELFGYLAEKAKVCGTCGTREDDWLDADGRERADMPLEARTIRCIGCELLEDAREGIPEGQHGVHVALFPVGDD